MWIEQLVGNRLCQLIANKVQLFFEKRVSSLDSIKFFLNNLGVRQPDYDVTAKCLWLPTMKAESENYQHTLSISSNGEKLTWSWFLSSQKMYPTLSCVRGVFNISERSQFRLKVTLSPALNPWPMVKRAWGNDKTCYDWRIPYRRKTLPLDFDFTALLNFKSANYTPLPSWHII